MSADTMPCGCLGHADHEDLCRYPALIAERDEAERLGAIVVNERDEARQQRDDANAARERAEANNAALSKHIDTACHLLSLGQVERAVSYLRKAASHEHPGAALVSLADAVRQYQHRDETTLLETFQRLMDERARIAHMHAPEYVQALERLSDATREYLAPTWPNREHDLGPVRAALATVDTLKGKP